MCGTLQHHEPCIKNGHICLMQFNFSARFQQKVRSTENWVIGFVNKFTFIKLYLKMSFIGVGFSRKIFRYQFFYWCYPLKSIVFRKIDRQIRKMGV